AADRRGSAHDRGPRPRSPLRGARHGHHGGALGNRAGGWAREALGQSSARFHEIRKQKAAKSRFFNPADLPPWGLVAALSLRVCRVIAGFTGLLIPGPRIGGGESAGGGGTPL